MASNYQWSQFAKSLSYTTVQQPHLLVCERLLGHLLVQLLLEDLELRIGLSQLLLEPGDLVSVLLILSPVRYNLLHMSGKIKICFGYYNVKLKTPEVTVFVNEVSTHTVVFALHSAEL